MTYMFGGGGGSNFIPAMPAPSLSLLKGLPRVTTGSHGGLFKKGKRFLGEYFGTFSLQKGSRYLGGRAGTLEIATPPQ